MPQRDRRKDPRIDLVNEVFFEVNRVETSARWTDISQGGIFIQTISPLPVGEQLNVRIRLPSSPKLYHAVGVVRHSLTWVGMGLQFTHIELDAKDLINYLPRITKP